MSRSGNGKDKVGVGRVDKGPKGGEGKGEATFCWELQAKRAC